MGETMKQLGGRMHAAWAGLALGWVGACGEPNDAASISEEEPLAFTDQDAGASRFGAVYALMQAHCVSCHGADKALDLSTPELARTELVAVAAEYRACASDGGVPNMRVVAGDPAASLLIDKLSATPSCGKAMPPTGQLSEEEIAVFRAWVAGGASP
jgi:mono/diheme cytochrome c family protein